MRTIGIKEGGHLWEKQNLYTLVKAGRSYDLLKCKHCGITGKRISTEQVTLKSSYSDEKVFNCDGKRPVAQRVRIIHCHALGEIFKNITDGSEHDVITAPAGEKNDHNGVWVMGNGEPVKVLSDEFQLIK